MSVAFRRESDEEHKEPRFELPIPAGPNFVTPRGLKQIGDRIKALDRASAAAPDDAEREVLRRQLRYWQTRAATAELAPPPKEGVVGIGSRVRIRLGDAERVIAIVGHDEAEPASDRIAFSAPLARALMGAEASEVIDFNGTHGAIELIAIDAPDEEAN